MSEALECDELREKARLLREHVDGLSAPYVIPSTKELMALTMLDSASRMEQAADTILELRDDLQRANDAVQDAEHDESMAWDRVRKAEAENAKLRELVRNMFEEIEAGGFDPMVERHGKSTVYYEEDPSWRVGIRERIRELGIE